MYTDENYVSCCRERMPALLYNLILVSRELVPHFVSCRSVSRTNHTSVGVVRDTCTKRDKATHKTKGYKLAQKTHSPRNPLLARTGSSSASCPSVL